MNDYQLLHEIAVPAVSMTKDVCLAAAACIASYVAITGLHSWREQTKGEHSFQTAQKLAVATFALRERINHYRSAQFFPHEFEKDDANAKAPAPREESIGRWQRAYSRRWKSVWDKLAEFNAAALEAEALWGSAVTPLTEELAYCSEILWVTTANYLAQKAQDAASISGEHQMDENL
ncbi:MAG: hypothetical protein ABF271_01755, partial [Abyssibacter sp.]|uniref:hypothetical protein n=1 Tax=Abyssibacter sp. TaxID=2320200 RepID=UPI003219956C